MKLIRIAEDIISRIEECVVNDEPIDISILSKKMNISKFYLSRIFTAIMGISLNRYILSRRLNKALVLIANEDTSLTEIAYQLNFGTQSSFTRAFNDMFHKAPSKVTREEAVALQSNVPLVIKRHFKNYNGDVINDFSLEEKEPLLLFGIFFTINLELDDYRKTIKSYVNAFVEAANINVQNQCYLVYSNCKPDSPEFNVLFGIRQSAFDDSKKNVLLERFSNTVSVVIPGGFFADFEYNEDLMDISMIFETDFARILKMTRMERGKTEVELIQVFNAIDDLMDHYRVFLPIRKPIHLMP